MEFVASLADPMGLMTRYRKLRALEDGKEWSDFGLTMGIGGYRVRFVNYYTICTGRLKDKDREKKEKDKDKEKKDKDKDREKKEKDRVDAEVTASYYEPGHQVLPGPTTSGQHQRGMSATSISNKVATTSTGATNTINNTGVSSPPSTPASPRSSTSSPPPRTVPILELSSQSQISSLAKGPIVNLNARSEKYSLPPIPPPPVEPPLHPDLSHVTDSQVQKAHMKENKRLWKEHFRQVKAHAKLIKDREKVLAKLEGKAVGNPKRYSKVPEEKGKEKCDVEKKRKERKFCLIPKEAKDVDGDSLDAAMKDETWIKVFMGNVDEVSAHCGLFMAGEEIFETPAEFQQKHGSLGKGNHQGFDTGGGRGVDHPHTEQILDEERLELQVKRRQYERLVGDLAERIESWVTEHVGTIVAMDLVGQAMTKEVG